MSKGTPHRPIRIDDELWKPSLAKAKDEGTNVSAKIRNWLRLDLGLPAEEEPVKERDELPAEGRPRSHLPGESKAGGLEKYLDESRQAVSNPEHRAAVEKLPPKFKF